MEAIQSPSVTGTSCGAHDFQSTVRCCDDRLNTAIGEILLAAHGHFLVAANNIEEATKNLTPEDRAKVLSGEPIIITVNAHTGMVESIEPLP